MEIRKTLLLLFFILLLQNVHSQCPPVLDQSQWVTWSGATESDRWQSFVPGIQGDLSRVEVKASSAVNATITLSIYSGTGTGGALLFTGIYPFNVTGATPTLTFEIPCDQMPYVTVGSTYTLRFQGTFGAIYHTSNPYPSGHYFSAGGGVQTGSDLAFRTYVSDPNKPTASVSPINPTCAGFSDGSIIGSAAGGSPGYTYLWSPSGQTTVNATGLMAGNQTLVVTDAVGCNSCEQVAILTDPLAITADAGLGQTYCVSDFPIPLSGSVTVASGGNWTGGTGTFSPNASTLNANYTPSPAEVSSGTVTLLLNTTGNGACSPATDPVTFSILPGPSVSAGADLSICAGNSIVMSGTGSATGYTWDSGITDGVSFAPLVGVYSYIVTGTDGSGCTNKDTVNVTVSPLPTTAISSSTLTTICSGDVVTFTGANASTYEFFLNGSSVQGPSASSAYNNGTLVNGDQIYVVGTTAGCSAPSSTLTFTVNSLPSVVFGALADICDNDSPYTLVEGTPSGGTYTGPGVTAGIFDPASVAPGFSSLTYTFTDGNGCTDAGNQNIQVLTAPTIVASTNDTICNGDISTISVTGGFSYSWDNGLGAGASHNVSPAVPTNYTVVGIGGNGCSNEDSVLVYILPAPTVTFSPIGDICISAGSYTLTEGTPAGGTYSGPGVAGGVLTPSTAGIGTHTLYYNYTDGSGCSNLDSTDVIVYSTPAVVASASNLNLCDGESLTLTGSGALTYTWDNGASNAVAFVPAVGTVTYTVTGADANSCLGTDQVTVTVNPLPIINGGLDQTACENDLITLTATGGVSYSWSNGISNGVPFAAQSGNTIYIVSGVDANNCSNTDSVLVAVNPVPVLVVSSDQYFCEGDSVQLTASGASAFNWDSGASLTPTYSVVPSTSVLVTVVGTTNGCSSSADIQLTLDDPNLISAGSDQEVCPGFQAFLNATGGSNYLWNGPSIVDVSNQNINLTVDTTAYYHVLVTTANGCQYLDSVLITLSLDPNCSIEPVTTITPNGDGRNDFWLIQGIEAFYDNNVSIYNRWGDLVFESANYDNDLIKWEGTNQLGNPVGTGTYFYVIEIANGPTSSGWIELLK